MNKLMIAMATFAITLSPFAAFAQPDLEPNSYAAMGCMKLRECTKGVTQLKSADQLINHYQNSDFDDYKQEIARILTSLDKAGVKVFLADPHNFPRTHRGTYYTDTNMFFLNSGYVYNAEVFMKVFRHEGWHAAQDCMAGTIDNSMIAVIHNDEIIPQPYKLDAEIRYGMMSPKAIPWEQEAIWAGNVPNMTADALESCSTKTMWTDYTPTPKTAEWLTENGYINQ